MRGSDDRRVAEVFRGGRKRGYFIIISFIILPQPSHFIIALFMSIGPILISWQSGHIIIAICIVIMNFGSPRRQNIPEGI